jgi:hypothetical protein
VASEWIGNVSDYLKRPVGVGVATVLIEKVEPLK